MGLGFLSWNWLPLLPDVRGRLSDLRRCRDQPRPSTSPRAKESEIVAGFHVEYSGMAFAVLPRRIRQHDLVSFLASILFLGAGCRRGFCRTWVFLALVGKISAFALFLWFRATFPRFRYDQIMRLGWKVFIPVTSSGGRRRRLDDVAAGISGI